MPGLIVCSYSYKAESSVLKFCVYFLTGVAGGRKVWGSPPGGWGFIGPGSYGPCGPPQVFVWNPWFSCVRLKLRKIFRASVDPNRNPDDPQDLREERVCGDSLGYGISYMDKDGSCVSIRRPR